jgi:hypothetical protein
MSIFIRILGFISVYPEQAQYVYVCIHPQKEASFFVYFGTSTSKHISFVHKSYNLESWNLEVPYHVHGGPHLIPILSRRHPVHTFPPYFPKIYFNIEP